MKYKLIGKNIDAQEFDDIIEARQIMKTLEYCSLFRNSDNEELCTKGKNYLTTGSIEALLEEELSAKA